MKNAVKLIVLSGLILVSIIEIRAQNDRYLIPSPKAIGMGGAGVAVLSQDHIFFYNPAQLNRLKYGRMTIIDFQVSFNKNLWDQIDFYNTHQDEFKNLEDFSDDQTTKFFKEASNLAKKRAQVGFSGPVALNMMVKNFGIGLFTRADVDYQMKTGASGIPIINASLQADFLGIASAAYGFNKLLPGKLSLGGSIKYIYRWTAGKFQSISNLNSDIVAYHGKAIGLDLAALYNVTRRLYVGCTIFDVNSPTIDYEPDAGIKNDSTKFIITPEGKIEPSLRLGVAYYTKWSLTPLVNNIILALDIDQPFDTEITFFKKLYFGIEASLTPVFQIRTGFAQGYPTFGFGINLSVLIFDCAFYGEEWGHYAGQQSNLNYLFRIRFGF